MLNKAKQNSLIILKVIFLQSFFYLCASYAKQDYQYHFFTLAIIIMLSNYFLIRKIIKSSAYIKLCLCFFVSGYIQDTILIYIGLLNLPPPFPPLWLPTLWLIFLAYYGDVFKRMLFFPVWLMATLGALGGSFAYYRGLKIIGITATPQLYLAIAVVWAIFMPWSLKYFKKNSIYNDVRIK